MTLFLKQNVQMSLQDDDVSHDSSSSPMTTYPTQTPFVLPPPPFGMSMTTNPMVPPGHFHPYASYYGAPDAQPMFYSSMWQNFKWKWKIHWDENKNWTFSFSVIQCLLPHLKLDHLKVIRMSPRMLDRFSFKTSVIIRIIENSMEIYEKRSRTKFGRSRFVPKLFFSLFLQSVNRRINSDLK